MRALERGAIALVAIGAWQVWATPELLMRLEDRKAGRAAPPSPTEVRAQLALLPQSDRPDPVVLALTAALERDTQLSQAETTWNLLVAQSLTAPERKRAELLADVDGPRRAPPVEAPEADGDVVFLARTLLENYGYEEVSVPTPVSQDRWPGVDRRGRARGIAALALEKSLDPDTAHVVLTATLVFLDAQLKRADNSDDLARLLPIAMGEAPG